jgi:hypothetical protein
MKAPLRLAMAMSLMAATVATTAGFALTDDESAAHPEQAAAEHFIRLKVVEVTPLEQFDRGQSLKLLVERHYGKIEARSLERAKTHETQRFTILFFASPGVNVKPGDILDYRLVRYLSLEE